MKEDNFYRKTAAAGGGSSGVPFYDVVAPTLYIGEAISATLWGGYTVFARAAGTFNRWRWERATRKALEGLDSRTLADIGVARSEIPAIARTAAENPTYTPTRRSLWSN